MITAEIYKGGSWRELHWKVGESPRLTTDIESGGMFQFRSPVANISVFDLYHNFGYGYQWQILRGDKVRIKIFGTDLFYGEVDRSVKYDNVQDSVSFSATGYLSAVTGTPLGRKPIFDGDGRTRAIGRYVRKVTEDDIDYEEVTTPYIYEVRWALLPENRSGWKYEQRFDTSLFSDRFEYLDDVEVVLGDDDQPISIIARAGGYENFTDQIVRRQIDRIYYRSVPIDNIIIELVKYLNCGSYRWALTADIGQIDEIPPTLLLIDKRFSAGRYLINDQLFAFGRELGVNDLDNPYQAEYEVYSISGVDANRTAIIDVGGEAKRLTYSTRDNELVAINAGISQLNPQDGDIYSVVANADESLKPIRRTLLTKIGDDVILTELHSWARYDISDNIYVGYVYTEIEINRFIIDESGYVELLEKSLYFEKSESIENNLLPELADSFIDVELRKSVNFIANPIENEFKYIPILSNNEDNQAEFQFDNNIYGFSGEFFLVDTIVDKVAINQAGQSVGSLLLDIAKLTSSLIYVDSNERTNTLYIVNRNYFTNVKKIDRNNVIRYSIENTSFYGDELPTIKSSIIQNELFNNWMENYYKELMEGSEVYYNIEFILNSSTKSIKIFDKLEVGGIAGYITIKQTIYGDQSIIVTGKWSLI